MFSMNMPIDEFAAITVLPQTEILKLRQGREPDSLSNWDTVPFRCKFARNPSCAHVFKGSVGITDTHVGKNVGRNVGENSDYPAI